MRRALAERLKAADILNKGGAQIKVAATGVERGLQCAPDRGAVTTNTAHVAIIQRQRCDFWKRLVVLKGVLLQPHDRRPVDPGASAAGAAPIGNAHSRVDSADERHSRWA